jgi:hypothetical protein
MSNNFSASYYFTYRYSLGSLYLIPCFSEPMDGLCMTIPDKIATPDAAPKEADTPDHEKRAPDTLISNLVRATDPSTADQIRATDTPIRDHIRATDTPTKDHTRPTDTPSDQTRTTDTPADQTRATDTPTDHTRASDTPTGQDEADIILEVLENMHIDSGKSPAKVQMIFKTFDFIIYGSSCLMCL